MKLVSYKRYVTLGNSSHVTPVHSPYTPYYIGHIVGYMGFLVGRIKSMRLQLFLQFFL